MNILIFAILVLIVAALICYALQQIPVIGAPFNWILQVLVIVLAAVFIIQKAGL